MKRLVLREINLEEFDLIKKIVNFFTNREKSEEISTINKKIYSTGRKSSPTIQNFSKEEFRRLIILVDLFSVLNPDYESRKGFSLQSLYQKLNKKYIRLFKENVYLK